MSSVPAWVSTASNHAIINRDELLQWLRLTRQQFWLLSIEHPDFPKPRFGGASKVGPTKASRWRVGDVRAWLAGSQRLIDRETATPVAAERKTTGSDPMSPHLRGRYIAEMSGIRR